MRRGLEVRNQGHCPHDGLWFVRGVRGDQRSGDETQRLSVAYLEGTSSVIGTVRAIGVTLLVWTAKGLLFVERFEVDRLTNCTRALYNGR